MTFGNKVVCFVQLLDAKTIKTKQKCRFKNILMSHFVKTICYSKFFAVLNSVWLSPEMYASLI